MFQDIVWAACYVLSGDFWFSENENNDIDPHQWQHEFWYKNVLIPLVCLFPLWIRFNQCLRRYMDTKKRFPNLANATKYAMSQTVTLFGEFHALMQFPLTTQPSNSPSIQFTYYTFHPIYLLYKGPFTQFIYYTATKPSTTSMLYPKTISISFKSFGWGCSLHHHSIVSLGMY